jgi:hypothetical protein
MKYEISGAKQDCGCAGTGAGGGTRRRPFPETAVARRAEFPDSGGAPERRRLANAGGTNA